jgi:hypothetical protein
MGRARAGSATHGSISIETGPFEQVGATTVELAAKP